MFLAVKNKPLEKKITLSVNYKFETTTFPPYPSASKQLLSTFLNIRLLNTFATKVHMKNFFTLKMMKPKHLNQCQVEKEQPQTRDPC